jgi:hypothetical protein
MLTVLEFLERDGASPFGNWVAALDAIAAQRSPPPCGDWSLGNFSNVKGVGAGVFEYRIADRLSRLLRQGRRRPCDPAGRRSKKRPDRDIATARWKGYKKRTSQET